MLGRGRAEDGDVLGKGRAGEGTLPEPQIKGLYYH